MITISLCMIVKNEEQTLERCLTSVKDMIDEVIIVDTGSTDRTKELAAKWTAKVFDFPWSNDFAAARNYSFAQATMDYILWLDADDLLLPGDLEKLIHLKENLDPSVDAVSMDYACAFDDRGSLILSVRRYRLLRREKKFKWNGIVHEDLAVNGISYDSDIVVTHRQIHPQSDRNLRIYENLLASGKTLGTRDLLHYATELYQSRDYEKAIEYYLKFIRAKEASIEQKIQASIQLSYCYHHIGNQERELQYIFKSFEYDVPHPESCCQVGHFFLENKQITQAIFWYKLATEVPVQKNNWGVINHASRTWLPHMQLGLCYHQLGDQKRAYHHTKIALTYNPNDERLLNNIHILEELLEKNGE